MTTKLLLTSSSMVDNIWFTVHKGIGNKMNNKTSVMMTHTPLCEKRHNIKGTVCSRCYSLKLSKYRRESSMRKYMEHNSKVLRGKIFKLTEITLISTPDGTLRYNSTGDNIDTNEVVNIFLHANKNHHLKCASWTKNYGLYNRVMKNIKVPKNLNLIWSMPILNSKKFIIPKGFTKSFYVYTSKEELLNGMKIASDKGYNTFECQLHCASCQHCYHDKHQTIVFELIR